MKQTECFTNEQSFEKILDTHSSKEACRQMMHNDKYKYHKLHSTKNESSFVKNRFKLDENVQFEKGEKLASPSTSSSSNLIHKLKNDKCLKRKRDASPNYKERRRITR